MSSEQKNICKKYKLYIERNFATKNKAKYE